MKVLHVITGLAVGGAQAMLVKLLGATAGQHHGRVASLTGDGPVGERILALGVEVDCLTMRPGRPDPRAIWQLARSMRAYRPDVVQTWLYHADLLGGIAAALAGKPPVLWGIRNAELDAGTSKWLTRRTLDVCALLSSRLPTRIVSNSERARDHHVRLGYDASRMVVIPNGFDAATYGTASRDEVRRELGISAEAQVVGLVARFDPMKDLQTFARAAGIAASSRPHLAFVLCGEGLTADNAELGAWLHRAGVAGRTLLLGRRSDVPRILSALDLFTLSSASEGFPNALGEAMASGIPSVVTDVGDCRWIVGGAGRVVPPRDASALAREWCALLDLPRDHLRALGALGRTRIAAEFSVEAVAAKFVALYEDVRRPSPV
jgi:glycosyltransferase involved in cell wall biosynthesis